MTLSDYGSRQPGSLLGQYVQKHVLGRPLISPLSTTSRSA